MLESVLGSFRAVVLASSEDIWCVYTLDSTYVISGLAATVIKHLYGSVSPAIEVSLTVGLWNDIE